MKYTLFAKSGKVPSSLTFEEHLEVLQRKHGSNGRAIIRELLECVIELERQARWDEHRKDLQQLANESKWWGLGTLLASTSVPAGTSYTVTDESGEIVRTGIVGPRLPGRDFCHYCGIEGDENTLCVSTGCCQNCLDAGR